MEEAVNRVCTRDQQSKKQQQNIALYLLATPLRRRGHAQSCNFKKPGRGNTVSATKANILSAMNNVRIPSIPNVFQIGHA